MADVMSEYEARQAMRNAFLKKKDESADPDKRAMLDGDVNPYKMKTMSMGSRGADDVPPVQPDEDPSADNLWNYKKAMLQKAQLPDEGEMVKSPDAPIPPARPDVKMPQTGDEWAEFFKKHPDYLDKLPK